MRPINLVGGQFTIFFPLHIFGYGGKSIPNGMLKIFTGSFYKKVITWYVHPNFHDLVFNMVSHIIQFEKNTNICNSTFEIG